ncbi:recombinase family protein [Cytobacillus kochii]|uniref:recombinase family protein n=1 Tax=Cytobacillus kochii TaxID=859143 RepID=UPI00402A7F02
MKNAAIYIRVSTQEQVENYSIEVQKERLEAFCKAKGLNVYNTYIDGGFSGATLNRPALKSMLNDIKEIDTVIVYKLDRLSRSQKDTLELIEEYFLKNKVDFISITETLDTSTPFGKAMIGILSVFAQLERETIAERMRMGHIKRAENGLRGMGGDYDPAGYFRKDGALHVNEEEAKHVKRAFDLYEQYHSITKIQERLKEEGYKVWRFRRYRDILANKLYIGYVSFAGKHYKGQHTPFIEEEQFYRVQDLLERHKGHNAHKAKKALLVGLITCDKCGENYVSYSTSSRATRSYGRIYYYYTCRARRFPSEYEEKCNNKNWNRQKLEQMVLNEMKKIIVNKNNDKGPVNKINYDKLIKEVDLKLERILELYSTNTNISPDILEKQVEKINLEKEKLLEKKLKQAKENEPNKVLDKINKLVINFDEMSFSDKQAIVNSLIENITVNENDVSIDWRF